MLKNFYLQIGLWALTKLFSYIDVYSPGEDVVAITFSNDQKYIEKVTKIDQEERAATDGSNQD